MKWLQLETLADTSVQLSTCQLWDSRTMHIWLQEGHPRAAQLILNPFWSCGLPNTFRLEVVMSHCPPGPHHWGTPPVPLLFPFDCRIQHPPKAFRVLVACPTCILKGAP